MEFVKFLTNFEMSKGPPKEPLIVLYVDDVDTSCIDIKTEPVKEGNGSWNYGLIYVVEKKKHRLQIYFDRLRWVKGIALGYEPEDKKKEPWERGWCMLFKHPTKKVFLDKATGKFTGLDPENKNDAMYLKVYDKGYAIENRIAQLLVDNSILENPQYEWKTRIIRYSKTDQSASITMKLSGQSEETTKTWKSYTKIFVRSRYEPIPLEVEKAVAKGTCGFIATVAIDLQAFIKSEGKSVVRHPVKQVEVNKWGKVEEEFVAPVYAKAQANDAEDFEDYDAGQEFLDFAASVVPAQAIPHAAAADFNVISQAEVEASQRAEEALRKRKAPTEDDEAANELGKKSRQEDEVQQ